MPVRPSFWLLVRIRGRALANRVDQALAEAPLKVFLIAVFILSIWGSLYLLFGNVFWLIKQQELASIIAVPYVFGFFFVALLVMLVLSNGVLIYGALFRDAESAYLLASPTRAVHVVAIKYVEALFFSSWALLLLGVPLMLAMATMQFVPWYFYVFFTAFFLCFVVIPGAWGLLLAWGTAMFLPRSVRRLVLFGAGAAGASVVWWLIGAWQHSPSDSALWLKRFLEEVRFVRSAFLPSAWVTSGVTAAIQGQPRQALFYLFVVWANAVFFSWLAVVVVSGRLTVAFSRAEAAGGREYRGRGWPSAVLTSALFFYTPAPMRTMIRKDVRSFLRDPGQWAQLLILFGLLAIYTVNIPTLRLDFATPRWQLLISFLNMVAVSLILATFTSRFVFPMISLEGDQMWLLGLLPLPVRRLVAAKFVFALTVALVAALSVTALSCRALQVGWTWAVVKLVTAAATCVGLCGLAVGLGARLPVFGQRNTARIASGFGGTVNLIFSVVFVSLVGVLFGWISLRAFRLGGQRHLDAPTAAALGGIVCMSIGIAAVALWVGVRHLRARDF
jgi:ABC-2 type transport system permease protein